MLPWPPAVQCCFEDGWVYGEGTVVTWHALGFCTPDIIYALRRACGSPWQAETLRGKPLSVARLTPTAMAAFTAWFEGTGQLRVGEHYHPQIRPLLRSHPETAAMVVPDRYGPPPSAGCRALAPVWFAGDVRQIPALLALRNRLLDPRRYP